MFIALHGMKHHALCYHGVKLIAHSYSWSDVLRSLLYMERSLMLIAIHGMKLYAQCFTRSEATCLLLYKE